MIDTKKEQERDELHRAIWAIADELRGAVDGWDFKNYVLGTMFYRYISENLCSYINNGEIEAGNSDFDYAEMPDDEAEEARDGLVEEKGFFILPSELFCNVLKRAANDENLNETLESVFRHIEESAKGSTSEGQFAGLFDDYDVNSNKLGSTVPKRNEMLVKLLKGVADMNLGDVKHHDIDAFGDAYEYLMTMYASNAGKSGGEFFTPADVSELLTRLGTVGKKEINKVYDPACGSGGMFVQSAKFIQAHSGNRNNISVYGQEANADTWKMAKMNMAIRGIEADFGPHQADTFSNDLHKTLKADFILANPPFNYHPWGQERLTEDVRWKYGVPPANNANYAWIQHMIHHLAPNGKIGLVLANGALSTQSSGEGEIRKRIIEDDLIEGIVAMPTQLFYSVTIPVTLWFISKNKKQKGKTLFIDARKMGFMVDRKHRDFSDEDIARLADTFTAFQNGELKEVKGFCAVASTEEIAKQDYILTPGRYVGIEEQEDDGEPFDEKMKRLTSELSEMFEKSHELENEIREKLGAIGYEV